MLLLKGELVPIGWLKAILLGLLQGLTEFLPVSSTAHMAIVPQLFHQPDPGAAFSAIVQLGPIAAIIIYFRADLERYIRGIVRTRLPSKVPKEDVDARLGWYTLLGSLPILVIGWKLEPYINREFRAVTVIGVSMIVLAILLLIAERIGRKVISLERMSLGRSQAIGWAQVLGLIPGCSRSGSTITAGLFLGLDRESAARFSFLLGIPAITAAGLYKLYKVLKETHLGPSVGPYLLANSGRRPVRLRRHQVVPRLYEGAQHRHLHRLPHRLRHRDTLARSRGYIEPRSSKRRPFAQKARLRPAIDPPGRSTPPAPTGPLP